MDSSIDHRLDCEHMSWLHEACNFIPRIVRDIRRTVEEFTNSVSTISSIYGQSSLIDVLANDVSYISVHGSRLADLNSLLKALIGLGDQEFTRLSDLSNQISLIQINIEPVLEHCDIQVDNISILEGSAVWNSVANDLIY